MTERDIHGWSWSLHRRPVPWVDPPIRLIVDGALIGMAMWAGLVWAVLAIIRLIGS